MQNRSSYYCVCKYLKKSRKKLQHENTFFRTPKMAVPSLPFVNPYTV